MADIRVELESAAETSVFGVTVSEGGSETRHRVTVTESEAFRFAASHPSKEEFVRACFEFLLERESKEQIVPSFAVSEIQRYFPEFEREILARPAGSSG